MAFVQAMNRIQNETQKRGVNGANVYTEEGVGDARLTLFTMLNRDLEEEYIQKYVEKIVMHGSMEEIRDLFVMAFQTRDVRGGKGEKKLFYSFMKVLHSFHPNTTRRMLHLVPEYGCWRDMWELWRKIPALSEDILRIVKAQYIEDLCHAAMGDVEDMSLLAKWLPREKSATYRGFARWIARTVYPNERSERDQLILYRKETSFMNSKLKTVEVHMCAGRWRKIKPEAVPGRCLKLYNKAFLNEKTDGELRHPEQSDRMKCRDHFLDFIQGLASGEKKAHGAHVVLPHELVSKALDSNMTAEQHIINQAQWDSIREETLKLGGLGKAIAMCDFSGSMAGTPLQISMALGILISECTHDAFRDYLLTFDSEPEWHSFVGHSTLQSKVRSLDGCGQGLNTDFNKACRMILNRMHQCRVPVDEAPDDLIVITDMGFDRADRYSEWNLWESQISDIRREFQEAGEKLWGKGNGWKAPRIVIWNVRAEYKDFHATAHQEGVVQLSGWSPSMLKALQKGGGQMITPYHGMRTILDDERYDPVRTVWWNSMNRV